MPSCWTMTGKTQVMTMGCYGIGVSRIVAAAIEQRHDEAGIVWPQAMAPWRVVVCVINSKHLPAVTEAAEALYQALRKRGMDVLLDDRGLRAGSMFADMELIGIPHRVVVSERGWPPAHWNIAPAKKTKAVPSTRMNCSRCWVEISRP